jgi:hypothetical protein
MTPGLRILVILPLAVVVLDDLRQELLVMRGPDIRDAFSHDVYLPFDFFGCLEKRSRGPPSAYSSSSSSSSRSKKT